MPGSVRCRRDGSGHVNVPYHSAFNLLNFAAFLRAVRITKAPAAGEVYPLFTLGGLNATDLSNFWLGYINTAGVTYLKVAFVTSSAVEKAVTVAYSMTVGEWYAIAGTRDDTSEAVTLYAAPRRTAKNQTDVSALTQLGQTTFATFRPHPSTADLRIGSDTDASGVLVCANADMADPGLYSVALSKAAMDALLLSRLAVTEASMIAGYRCDEGTGSTL